MKKDTYKILVINPGSTSTKVGIFENCTPIFVTNVQHSHSEIAKYEKVTDQLDYRKALILDIAKEKNVDLSTLDCVVGRGGFIKPVESGTYEINEKLIDDLHNSIKNWGREHPSNLGGLIAYEIANLFKIPSYIVDPVVVDEMEDVARISGLKEIKRTSIFHALNIRSCIRIIAKELKRPLNELNLIGGHFGGGISIVCYRKGRIIDENNALLGMGPFSPQRCGALPTGDLVEFCFNGQTKADVKKKLSKNGGLVSYLGTDDVPEIISRINNGDKEAKLVIDAMCYQIAKNLGEYYAVLKGECDGLFLTGGIIFNDMIYDTICSYFPFIKNKYRIAGEREMEALAQGAYLVLNGEEKSKLYS